MLWHSFGHGIEKVTSHVDINHKGIFMTKTTLIMRDKTVNGIVMVSPKDINEQLSHTVATKSRKIGTTKQKVVRNEFAIVRMVDVEQCGSNSCSFKANENGRLSLSGSDPVTQLLILEDLYANAKKALTDQPATLQGLPLPFNLAGMTLTDQAVVTP